MEPIVITNILITDQDHVRGSFRRRNLTNSCACQALKLPGVQLFQKLLEVYVDGLERSPRTRRAAKSNSSCLISLKYKGPIIIPRALFDLNKIQHYVKPRCAIKGVGSLEDQPCEGIGKLPNSILNIVVHCGFESVPRQP